MWNAEKNITKIHTKDIFNKNTPNLTNASIAILLNPNQTNKGIWQQLVKMGSQNQSMTGWRIHQCGINIESFFETNLGSPDWTQKEIQSP